jgi:rhodanese-related sulfurtransferase
MKKYLGIFILLVVIIVATYAVMKSTNIDGDSTSFNNQASNPIEISSPELEQMLVNKDFALIDLNINEKKHIPNTDYQVPYTEYQYIEDYLQKNFEKTVVLYDKDGSQSAITANELVKRGYKKVYYLTGGSQAWATQGKTITSDISMDMSMMNMGDMGMMMHNKFEINSFIEMQKGIIPQNIGTAKMSEISMHNTLEDCWVVVDNKVYHLPYYWTQMHPGGQETYKSACGTDISEMFKAHTTEKPSIVLQYFYIGDLAN